MTYVFWTAVFLVFYAYLGYPMLLMALPVFREKNAETVNCVTFPSVIVILPAYNEEAVICEKIKNLFDGDYPADRIDLVFVSDASTDDTDKIVSEMASQDKRIHNFRLSERLGKAAALNKGLEEATGDILVFTDASLMIGSQSIRNLIGAFESPLVGCASGEDRVAGGQPEGLYGKYELFLRRKESDVHSVVGASGCFYAQRQELCKPFVAGVAPDFQSVLDTAQQGFRSVTVPAATGLMRPSEDSNEFSRKVRTVLRGMTTLSKQWELLNPFKYGLFAFMLFSHKFIRWIVPYCLLVMLASSAALSGNPLFFAALVGQLAFYGLGVLALVSRNTIAAWPVGKISGYFTVVNAAVFFASIKWILGIRQEVWTPTRRAQ